MLPRALADAIDWTATHLEQGSFVDPKLRDSYTDLLFSAKLGEERVLIYLLLEHQSTADALMPLRMLAYMVRIWQRHLATTEAPPIPAIIPVVVSHADDGRIVATRMHDLVAPFPASVPALSAFVPAFDIVVDDITAASDAELRARALGALPKLALWLLRHGRRGETLLRRLPRWGDVFREVARARGGIEAMHRVLRYLEAVLGERRFERARGMITSLGTDTEEAVVKYSDRLFAEGEAKGRAEGERSMLLKQLALKFGPLDDATTDRVRTADSDALERWLERIIVVTQLDAVFES